MPKHAYQRMRAAGAGVIAGTLGAAAFAVVGAFVGPAELVGAALAAGAALLAASHVLERRARRAAETPVNKLPQN